MIVALCAYLVIGVWLSGFCYGRGPARTPWEHLGFTVGVVAVGPLLVAVWLLNEIV